MTAICARKQYVPNTFLRDVLLDVYRDEIRLPDGRISTREYTLHPGAVVMIPVLPNGQIMLIRQFRYPAKKVMIELPAGKLDEGEDYRTTAYRELEEEIGYKAGKITYVAEIDPCVGYSDEHMWITLAEDLHKTEENTDHDEFIEPFPVSLEQALAMVWEGQITDVKTVIGILWTDRLLSNHD